MNNDERQRILFVAEGATLAHVVRLVELASSLPTDNFEIFFACSAEFRSFVEDYPFQLLELPCLTSKQFLSSLEEGDWPYDEQCLSQYVRDDLELIRVSKPDCIVGDMRLSLAVSAPVAEIPYIALTNAYWSPFASQPRWSIPPSSITEKLGVRLSNSLFRLALPLSLRKNASYLNAVRKKYKLPPFKDFLTGFTYGDTTLYADTPELVNTKSLPKNHHYIGPICWSPDIELPDWWGNLPPEDPVVYVSLGSSGHAKLYPMICEALMAFPFTVIFATAGRFEMKNPPSNFRFTRFIPGDMAARRAQLVICNGGSPSAYQALSEGTPVLGIPSHLDQILCMQNIEARGAGILLRSDTARIDKLQAAIVSLMDQAEARRAAKYFAQAVSRYDAKENFFNALSRLVPQVASRLRA